MLTYSRLVQEILNHVENLRVEPARISFVGHSLGAILVRSALSRPALRALLPRLHTFLSLSGPHLGTLYNSSGLVNAGTIFFKCSSSNTMFMCLKWLELALVIHT